MARKKRRLTEGDWSEVFRLRCRDKRGENLTASQHALCLRAFREDEDRYVDMNAAVFKATKPFGA